MFDLSSKLRDIFTSHGERCHRCQWLRCVMCLWLGQLVEFVVFFCGFRFLFVSFLGAAGFPWPVLLVVQLERDEMWWGLSNWKVLLIYDVFHILDDQHLVDVWPTPDHVWFINKVHTVPYGGAQTLTNHLETRNLRVIRVAMQCSDHFFFEEPLPAISWQSSHPAGTKWRFGRGRGFRCCLPSCQGSLRELGSLKRHIRNSYPFNPDGFAHQRCNQSYQYLNIIYIYNG